MNARYHAIKESMNKITGNLEARGESMLPSPYTEDQPEALYKMLIDLVPVGTKVKATYMKMPGDVSTMTEFEGEVTDFSSISKDEPSFHISNGRFGILVDGSLLTEVAEAK